MDMGVADTCLLCRYSTVSRQRDSDGRRNSTRLCLHLARKLFREC